MDAMAFLGTPARKLLRGGSAAIAQAVADGGAALGFALDGAGAGDFLPSLERSATSGMAIADTAARKLLHRGAGGAIAEGISGDISFDVLGGVGQLVTGFFAALAGAAHQFVLPLEAFWRWLQAAAAAALPFVLGVATVLVLVALVWFCGPILFAVALGVCKALMIAVSYFGHCLYLVAVSIFRGLACLLPPCVRCCGVVTMKAPGAAGMLISRAAFEATPALYFLILRAAGPIVAAAVFCMRPVAWAVAAPVAALFRVSAGA